MSALERYLNEVWYGERAGLWLRPLSALYALGVRATTSAYRHGRREPFRAPCPVLVVGNRTVGGTGKTPLVIEVVRRLAERGARPGVISRGYGSAATSDRARRVDASSSAADVGDEPLLIARRAGVPVAVCPNRARACELLLEESVNVIVSDDGMQHLALARDGVINVIDGARGEGNGRCLPAGPLRWPAALAPHVDLDIVNGSGGDMRLLADGVRSLDTGTVEPLDGWAGRRVHAVAGIGHPARFFDLLREHGLSVIEHARADHAPLSLADVTFDDAVPVLMTEKDAVKLTQPPSTTCYDVPVRAELTPAASRKLDVLLDRLLDSLGLASPDAAATTSRDIIE